MILVLVGTNPYSFDRLVRAMDDYAAITDEEIFIQLGHTAYIPKNARHQRFLEKQEILKKIMEASLVITQGGYGSIADCLRAGKRIVAVPRKPELKEAPDRQEELVRELERLGRLVGVYDIKDLPAAIQKARNMKGTEKQESKIPRIIQDFLENN